MLGWSINLFRVRGIRISLHFSFLLLLAYCCYEGWTDGGSNGVWWGAADFFLIFTSVVLHELGHSFMAMRFGVGVHRILLSLVGGMAQFDAIPKKPVQELLITVAGPAVNFAIIATLWFFVDFPDGWDAATQPLTLMGALRLLLRANLVLGIFNLYPAFPMDGGRILRALLAMRLPYLRATKWAVNVGRVLALAGIAVALFLSIKTLLVLFVFILMAGSAEYGVLKRQEEQEARWKESLLRDMEGAVTPQPPIVEP